MPKQSPATDFNLVIVDPEKVIYENRVKRVIAPGIVQEIAILPDHTPLYSQLVKGEIDILDQNDDSKKIPIDGGIIRVKQNRASIIVGF